MGAKDFLHRSEESVDSKFDVGVPIPSTADFYFYQQIQKHKLKLAEAIFEFGDLLGVREKKIT